MNLLRLSDEIGSGALKNVIQLIHTKKCKPNVVHQHIHDGKGSMKIVDGSVGQSLIHDVFLKNVVP